MRRWILPSLATVVLTACSAPAPQPSTADASTPPPVSTTVRAVLPLNAYLANDDERRLVGRAYAVLVDRCMAAKGLPAVPAPDALPPTPPDSWRYGVSDPAVAAAHGYHPPPEYRPRPRPEHRMTDDVADQAGACAEEAARRLGKSRTGNYMDDLRAQALGVTGFEQSRADARVVAAISRWRDCMSAAGHPATDPIDVMAMAGTMPEPSAQEVATAEADVACKRETDLVATWHAVEAAYQDLLITANRTELEAGRTSTATAVRLAGQILGTPSPR